MARIHIRDLPSHLEPAEVVGGTKLTGNHRDVPTPTGAVFEVSSTLKLQAPELNL
jgi:hypothetical protein